MLRVTAAVEMVFISVGLAIGVLFNPALPKWAALGVVPYILFNLCLAVGLRDLVARILAHKRVREVAFFFLLLLAGLPQLLLLRSPMGGRSLRKLIGEGWIGWPWTATSNLIQQRALEPSFLILMAWVVAGAAFGFWQFRLSLTFDAQAAGATGGKVTSRESVLERIFRFPSLVWKDPLAALVEKEIRFLVRSPRFRLVFLMGFTFGLIWLPLSISAQRRFGNPVAGKLKHISPWSAFTRCCC